MVLGLSKALAAEGIDVTLITTNSNGDAGQPPLDVPLEKPVEQDSYQIIYFRCSPFRRYKFSLNLLRWLAAHAQEYDLAHIHALFSPVSSAAATIARYQKLPYLLRPLGTLDPADLQNKRQLKQIYGTLLERPNLAAAAGVHFTSEQEARISERFGIQTKDVVIPLGVELPDLPPLGEARRQLKIPPNQPLILFMSRIAPKKGLNLLVPALESLLRKLNFHFVLAGANPQDPAYEKTIQGRIQASKLGEQTTITGFVEGDLKLGLLRDADLFVLPSYYENFGIAVAEALATGTPAIISDQVHIWKEVRDRQAGWITNCTVEQLTIVLHEALSDAQARRERGENARRLAQAEYSWSAIAQRMIEVYQLLGRRSH